MSEKELRTMLDYASGFAEGRFAEFGAIKPIWYAVTLSGDSIITPPLAGAQDKDESIAMIRELFESRDVVRYLFIDEAWTLDTPVERAELGRIEREGLRNHPARVEVVMFTGEDYEAGLILAQRRIFRPQGGKAYLGPLSMQGELPAMAGGERTVEITGGMVGLLPNWGRAR